VLATVKKTKMNRGQNPKVNHKSKTVKVGQ